MIQIKRLSECTLEQALQAWNDGFKGYFIDATTTIDAFTARLGKEGLSPALSVVAFAGEQAIGLLLSGVRTINGKKVAWNGGTGVAPEFRSQGVGKLLVDAALKIYREEQVAIATLEAISQNEKAIALYQKMGYEVIDRLLFLQRDGALPETAFSTGNGRSYEIKRGLAQDVKTLPFYKGMSPWQTQWSSAASGESVIAFDCSGEAVGYSLFIRAFDDEGKLLRITLLQCEAKPDREDADDILRRLLQETNTPFEASVTRGTFNFPASNEKVCELLKEAGFEQKNEQVNMVRYM